MSSKSFKVLHFFIALLSFCVLQVLTEENKNSEVSSVVNDSGILLQTTKATIPEGVNMAFNNESVAPSPNNVPYVANKTESPIAILPTSISEFGNETNPTSTSSKPTETTTLQPTTTHTPRETTSSHPHSENSTTIVPPMSNVTAKPSSASITASIITLVLLPVFVSII